MRGFRGGISGLAMLAQLAGHLDFRGRAKMDFTRPPGGHSYRIGRKRGLPMQRSYQRGSKDRLILDRSSSVRKLQRYHNNGTIIPATGRHD